MGESNISVRTLTEIAEVLGVPVAFFFDEVTSSPVASSERRIGLLLAAYYKLDPYSRTLLVLIAKSLAEVGNKHLLAAE